MRWTKSLIPTLKEDPQEAEVVSHKLMIRGGYVRKLISGAYSYLPLGMRVLTNVRAIIKEEMDATGAQELLLPALQPPELWKKTGRYDVLGEVLIKFKDRHGKELVLGPTHEEIVTDLVANNIRSYKDLPTTLYQIQTKFRDEPRPRFGVMRTSEFIMKDAYSFDCDVEGLEQSYQKMYDAYCRIFERCGLPYIAVEADPGMMGGNVSHEFMVPAEAGEDQIIVCSKCGYAASTQVARCSAGEEKKVKAETKLPIAEVETPGITTIEKVSAFLKVEPVKLVKTLIYLADGKPVALLIRGDLEVNETKLKHLVRCDALTLADEKAVQELTNAPVGFAGPVKLRGAVRIVADYSVKPMVNFITGANKKDAHLVNVNANRDFELKEFADLRMITADDPCPACGKPIAIKRAIEIGHTFKLGTKYSEALGARFLDKDGVAKPCIMGCYGIGVTRILPTLIETSHDANGIVWPASIAPYTVVVSALNVANETVQGIAEAIYKKLLKQGVAVLYDDRNESAGIKFKDADLIGIPYQVIVGERNAKNDVVEIKIRKTGEKKELKTADALLYLKECLSEPREVKAQKR